MKYQQTFKVSVLDGLGNFINEIDIVLKKTDHLNKSRIIGTPEMVDFIRDNIFKKNVNTYEQAFAIYMNQSNNIIGIMQVSKGGITSTTFDNNMIIGSCT